MVPKVVLTGGPCAGKTSCLCAIRAHFGDQVVTMPETATLLLSSGFPPPGHASIHSAPDEWIQAFQGAILSIQQEVEASCKRLARNCRVRLIVCDRGVLDGAAYWPGGREAFLRHFGQSLEDCFARYQSVLHLQSLAESHPHLYGPEGNAIRYEGLADALRVEQAVRAAWEGHPGLVLIPAEIEPRIKIARVLDHIQTMLATA
ncbi:MAG TPA: ATP-binding protein [Gemmataceae bacterium]|nr:ATP-binding protein [Gemmataceae bacterium]